MASALGIQGNPGYIDRHGVAADALDKTIDALRMRYNKVPLQCSPFFRVEKANRGTYKESTFGTALPLPTINEDSDVLPFNTPVKGFPKEFTIVTYRSAIQAELAVTEDEGFPVVKRMMSGLLDSGRLLYEYLMADVLNNMTTAAYKGADGKALAALDHPFERAAQGTWSNLDATAAALTHANFSTARIAMRTRKNEFGDITPILVKKLVVPAQLEQKAQEIAVSEKVPENNLNATNVWANKFDVVVVDWLTDSNAWFLVGDRPAEYCGLVLVEGVPLNITALTGGDLSTDMVWGNRIRARVAAGHTSERNIQYNEGA